MSAPYWSLRAKVEQNVTAYFLANDTAGRLVAASDWAGSPALVPVRLGFTADLVEALPMVAVVAGSSSRYLPEVVSQDDNTREIKLRVSIRTATDEQSGDGASVKAEEYHNALVAYVLDLLNDMEILAKLAAIGTEDLTILQFDLTDEGQLIVDNSLESFQEVSVVAIPQ